MEKRKRGGQTTSQAAFLSAASVKHGGYYDYSQTTYLGAHHKITIICPVHGSFSQKAHAHLNYGCKQCGDQRGAASRRLSITDFIRRAGELHHFKYDYRHAGFDRQHQKIRIVCPRHGDFLQLVNDHLKGHGCVKCAKEYTASLRRNHTNITTETFVKRAMLVHGSRYDYSETVYRFATEDVRIRCNEHGIFDMLPGNHLAGYGCTLCASAIRNENSYQRFIERATEAHGSKYDYVEYHGMNEKAGIICGVHGLFYQRAVDHVKGCGCPLCGQIAGATALRYTQAEYEAMLAEKFDGRVTLAGDYTDLTSTTSFHCLAHGQFVNKPGAVLISRHGCKECGNQAGGTAARLTDEEFRQKATETHNGKYTYPATYTTTDRKIEIVCPRHGLFLQNAGNHLAGNGCPSCGMHRTAMQNSWLDKLGITEREVRLMIEGRRYKVDGFDPATRTVYEFYGDFWHGNLRLYQADQINNACGVTFGALNAKTRQRAASIVEAGYRLVEIWENDWKQICGQSS